jgi:uncharacterized phiE125 gp8 family phage protein
MALKIATPPTVEPVSATEAKLHLKMDATTDDTLIANLITAARETVEAIARRALITQTWDLVMDEWPAGDELMIPLPPLQTIVSVKYVTQNGLLATPTTFAVANYAVDTYSEPGRMKLVYGAAWPGDSLYTLNGVIVRFTAGFGVAVNVPLKYKQAILLLVGHWYANREQVVSGGSPQEIPFGVKALLWLDRNLRF